MDFKVTPTETDYQREQREAAPAETRDQRFQELLQGSLGKNGLTLITNLMALFLLVLMLLIGIFASYIISHDSGLGFRNNVPVYVKPGEKN